jgi:hypothetical protein
MTNRTFGRAQTREPWATVKSKRARERKAKDTEAVWTLADDPDPDAETTPLAWGVDGLGAGDPAFRS